jgi:hypothetical protein
MQIRFLLALISCSVAGAAWAQLPSVVPPREQLDQAAAARGVLAKLDPKRKAPIKKKFHVIYFTTKDVPPAAGWQCHVGDHEFVDVVHLSDTKRQLEFPPFKNSSAVESSLFF